MLWGIWMDFSDTTVIIPTLNEEENIEKLLELVKTHCPGAPVIVSDDGSKDRTYSIVSEKAKKNSKIFFLDRKKEPVKGLTASVVHAVKKTKTPYALVIDGDLQHPPEKLPEMAQKLREGHHVVIGTREKVVNEWAFHRKLMSKTAILMGQLRLLMKGIYVKDVVSGFFGADVKIFQDVILKKEHKFEPEGYKVLFDLLKQLDDKKKIGNVNYSFGLRKGGDSKINKRHIWLYLKSMFK